MEPMSTSYRSISAKLDAILSVIQTLTRYVMTDFTALNAAIADLAAKQQVIATNITNNDAAIQTAITALKTAIGAGDQAQVDAITSQISQLSASSVTEAGSIATETANLQAAVPTVAGAAPQAASPAATG